MGSAGAARRVAIHWAQLSPADATALGIRDGDTVSVSTKRGNLTMPAHVNAKLMAGYVWMPNGFGMISSDGMLTGANQNRSPTSPIATRSRASRTIGTCAAGWSRSRA